jgi:hypothetical protein
MPEILTSYQKNGESIVDSASMAAELAPNSVKTYHLAPEGFNVVRKKLLRQRSILASGIIVFTTVIVFRQSDFDLNKPSLVSLTPYFIVMVILIGALTSGLIKGMKKNWEAWTTYELVIGEDFLIRRVKDFPELEIRRDEVTSIKESPAGLQVTTKSRDRTIGIGSALIDFEDAKARLCQWMMPAKQTQQGWSSPGRWVAALPLFVLLLFGAFLLSAKSWILILSGMPLLAILLWSFALIRKSFQISDQMKRTSLLIFLPLLAIVAKLVQALINWQ